MLDEVLNVLAPEQGDSLLDATAGYGGHSSAILQKTGDPEAAVLIDRDAQAVEALSQYSSLRGATVIHDDFAHATKVLHEKSRSFDMILADFGVSSPHLDKASRGFSFNQDGPLDMRMDTSQILTAADVVNTSSLETLTDLIKTYGEESHARQIAKAVVDIRPISTTSELATVITRILPRKTKTHPATKTFQALRIIVNDELAQISFAVPRWVEMLKPGGRIAIISFHSLEDRIVKHVFREHGGNDYDADIRILTKKPTKASKQEIVFNPRARSAKLRAAVKK